MESQFNKLKGKTLVNVEVGNDKITFMTQDLKMFDMYHSQDCCESVTIESIVGDVADLIGHPLLIAEEVNNAPAPENTKPIEYDSETWTFYKLATIKGYVDIRWYGTSNGYYSESVDFLEVPDSHDMVQQYISRYEKAKLESLVKKKKSTSKKKEKKVILKV